MSDDKNLEPEAVKETAPENPDKTQENASADSGTPAPGKKKRRWLRILGWTATVIILLLIVVILARDVIIKAAVVNVGSLVTGTKVELDSFSTSFGGTVDLAGFRVANPAGYRQPYAFQVGRVHVAVNIGSLFSDPIEVKEILIDGTRVNFEMKLNGSSNLAEIQKNVESFSGQKSSSAAAEKPGEAPAKSPEATGEESAGKKVVIRLVRIDGTELSVSSELLQSDVPLIVPTIKLENLGEGKTFGETLNEFTAKVLVAFSNAISESGLQGVEDAVKDAGKNLGESLKQGGESLKEAGKNLEKSLKQQGGSLEEAGKDLKKGLHDLLEKK